MKRILLLLCMLVPLTGLSDPDAPPPEGESDDDKIVRLEALAASLRTENKQLESELSKKKQKLETRIKPHVPTSGTGYFSESSDPAELVFTFASTHAGKKINGQVDGTAPASGKTSKATVRASQKGKK
jgi:hypothetical protein